VLFIGCVGLVLNTLGCGAAPDKSEEETSRPQTTGVPAGETSQSLGVTRWQFPQGGAIVGVNEVNKTVITFEAVEQSKLRAKLVDGSERLLDPKVAQSDQPADSIDRLHRSLIADMKAAHARASGGTAVTETGELGAQSQAYSIIVGCCNGYGSTTSAQITKWIGQYQGWCHIDYTGYACYGYPYCWDVAGDCYWWY